MTEPALQSWHRIVESGELDGLERLLAEDAVFHSPVVHTPQAGRRIVALYLRAAAKVLLGAGFRYVREIASHSEAVLEFEAEIEGIHINGVDLIRWNEAQQIVDFKVMVRPLQAINLLHHKMAEMLQSLDAAGSSP